jgi:hypothetical protein
MFKSKLKISLLASRGCALLLAISIAVGGAPLSASAGVDGVINNQATSISQGDAATKAPGTEEICSALKNATLGDFKDDSGAELKTIDGECAKKYTYRTDQAKYCSKPIKEVITEAKKSVGAMDLDALCSGAGGRLTAKVETYCALRNIAQNSQALTYCDAHKSANKALTSLQVVRGLDAAAAAICWAEYLTWKASQASTGSKLATSAAAFGQLQGACGGAALAAGMGEIVQTISIFTGNTRHSAGDYSVDSSNNPSKKKEITATKAIEAILSSAGSLKGIQIGVCYYAKDKFPKLCGKTAETKHGEKVADSAANTFNSCEESRNARVNEIIANAATRSKVVPMNSFAPASVPGAAANPLAQPKICTPVVLNQSEMQEVFKLDHDLARAKKGMGTKNLEKVELAHQAAIIFTGLAAMRTISILSAKKTQKRAEETLKSMFNTSNNNVAMGIGGAASNNLPNLFAVTNSNYNVTPGNGTQQSASTAEPGSAESFLVPPGSPLGAAAEKFSSRIPAGAIAAMDNGNFGAGIASAAQTAGARDAAGLSAIKSQGDSLFANFPKDDGSGYKLGGGGGGSKGGDSKDAAPDLNLKALFGGDEEKKEDGPKNELAFRSLAAEEDIWHSQNPKGHNLFQIISEKYDGAQRKSAVGPDL